MISIHAEYIYNKAYPKVIMNMVMPTPHTSMDLS